jgi:hypothetical protein
MRVRVIAQTFTDLWRHRRMLNPFRAGFYAVELFSHKVMRYSVPLFLILLYFSNVLLAFQSPFFDFLLLFQLIFYVLGVAAWLLDRAGLHFKILTLPLYFVLANAAVVIAFYKFLRGERFAAWQPVREAETRGRRAEDAESVG